jgi:hypothetical protein
LRGSLESFSGRPAITAHPSSRVMREVFPPRDTALAHALSLCFFSSLTVLACGPFSPIEHAVPVEVDVPTIAALDEAEPSDRIELFDGSNRRALVQLHLSFQPSHLVLQLAARSLEGVVNREVKVGVALIVLPRMPDIHFTPIRQC